uniref:Putative secreted protein n=1 Tax=Ixodes ricinus TaxID=34613 RepID=A0A6B0U4L3_IXORI
MFLVIKVLLLDYWFLLLLFKYLQPIVRKNPGDLAAREIAGLCRCKLVPTGTHCISWKRHNLFFLIIRSAEGTKKQSKDTRRSSYTLICFSPAFSAF